MTLAVNHHEAAQRFEAVVEGQRCELNYTLKAPVMSMNRVFVPPPLEGRGIAGVITRYAPDTCIEQGWSVIPRCPYVAAWIRRHPDYQSVVAD
ncbi:MAG: GNAT family N-acetyltransferase [Pseudomonadota bacterium]